jgi:hypothetical protein
MAALPLADALTCLLLTALVQVVPDADIFHPQLPAEVRSAWTELISHDHWCQGTRVHTTHKNGVHISFVVQKLVRPGAILYHTIEYSSEDVNESSMVNATVECVNQRYKFTLEREKMSAGWVLTDLSTHTPDHANRSSNDEVTPEPLPIADLLLLPEGMWLNMLIESPGFKIMRWQQVTECPTLYRMDFVADGYADWSRKRNKPINGSIILDSDCSWCIREATITVGHRKPITKKKKFEYTRERLPIPIKTVSTYVDDSGRARSDVVEYKYARPAAFPPMTDFTLSAFGLPEPYGIEWERPIPWGLYIIGGTLGMVFVMGVVWRIRRWRAAAKGE